MSHALFARDKSPNRSPFSTPGNQRPCGCCVVVVRQRRFLQLIKQRTEFARAADAGGMPEGRRDRRTRQWPQKESPRVIKPFVRGAVSRRARRHGSAARSESRSRPPSARRTSPDGCLGKAGPRTEQHDVQDHATSRAAAPAASAFPPASSASGSAASTPAPCCRRSSRARGG